MQTKLGFFSVTSTGGGGLFSAEVDGVRRTASAWHDPVSVALLMTLS